MWIQGWVWLRHAKDCLGGWISKTTATFVLTFLTPMLPELWPKFYIFTKNKGCIPWEIQRRNESSSAGKFHASPWEPGLSFRLILRQVDYWEHLRRQAHKYNKKSMGVVWIWILSSGPVSINHSFWSFCYFPNEFVWNLVPHTIFGATLLGLGSSWSFVILWTTNQPVKLLWPIPSNSHLNICL